MSDAIDTSAAAVEALAKRLGRKSSLKEHGMWCTTMDDAVATMRALLAEREAARLGRDIVIENNAMLRAEIEAERDAAMGEAVRLREALKGVLEIEGWSEQHPRYIAARAALAKEQSHER